MNGSDVLDLASASAWTVIACGGPAVAAAMAVGVCIALLQALTQVQETTLTFVPKMLAVCIVVAGTATSVGGQFSIYAEQLYGRIEKGFAH